LSSSLNPGKKTFKTEKEHLTIKRHYKGPFRIEPSKIILLGKGGKWLTGYKPRTLGKLVQTLSH